MLFLLFAVSAFGAVLTRHDEPVAGEYIVEFNDELSAGVMSSHMTEVAEMGEILFEYKNLGNWKAYSARLDADALARVLENPLIRRVEQNGVMRATQDCIAQQGATWGLVRSAERALRISGEYKYEVGIGGGSNLVDTYVIDTGIYIAHQDFQGRAIWGTNTADNDNRDGNGHGTHVASTMIGGTYGLCKGCKAYAVKVLNNQGSGTTAGVIAGVDWVASQQTAKNKNGTKAGVSVGNMSLGGGFSSALNSAVTRCIAAGVVMAVAAGNDGRSACNYSPASTPNAITVMASDNTDRKASWSNFGDCCDVWAPGVSITAAWINSPTSTNTISGTSMASPHVAGIAAKLIWQQPSLTTPAQVWSRMDSLSSPGLISNPGSGSPNKLAYHGCPIA